MLDFGLCFRLCYAKRVRKINLQYSNLVWCTKQKLNFKQQLWLLFLHLGLIFGNSQVSNLGKIKIISFLDRVLSTYTYNKSFSIFLEPSSLRGFCHFGGNLTESTAQQASPNWLTFYKFASVPYTVKIAARSIPFSRTLKSLDSISGWFSAIKNGLTTGIS